MSAYSYEGLLAAKKRGVLDSVLRARVEQELYDEMSDEASKMVGFPDPDEDEDD